VRNKTKHTSVVTTGPTGVTRLSPRNGFNGLFRALPGDRAFLPPSLADRSAKLDASVGASGPHDFAVRKSVIRLLTLPRPPHPAPNVRDDHETPLCVGRDGGGYSGYKSDLGIAKTGIFFQKGLDRQSRHSRGDLPVGQIMPSPMVLQEARLFGRRASSSENLRPMLQKEFCKTICQ
jgi:hypothetical protein